jgi:hypothetical protein
MRGIHGFGMAGVTLSFPETSWKAKTYLCYASKHYVSVEVDLLANLLETLPIHKLFQQTTNTVS